MEPRIAKLLERMAQIKKGDFSGGAAAPAGDDFGKLEAAVEDLGDSLKREAAELKSILEITEKINAGFLLEEALNYAYESLRSAIPYDRIGFSLLEENGQKVVAHWVRSEAGTVWLPKGYSAPLKGSSLEEIIRSGKPRILNDLKAYLKDHPASDSTRKIVKEGMNSSLTCPLVALGKPIGFIFFSSMKTDNYRGAHIEMFMQVAGHLSLIAEKSRLYERLSELNQLKNKFLGIAAHDLRSPLTVMVGYLDFCLEGLFGNLTDRQKEAVHVMKRSSANMLALINDLLDVSVIESGRLELDKQEVDPAVFLKECCATNEVLAEAKSITLKLDLAPGLPKISLDLDRIAQVLDNLITNAVKFSNSNTTVTLAAKVEGPDLRVSVEDQGQGIPEHERSKLFVGFERTSIQPTAGEANTGLGLAIAKSVVEAHGGKIWAQSKVGVGSTFIFSIPVRLVE
jgi:signal transduction histidine kinase